MSTIIETACAVETYFRDRQWRFCHIGGIAVIRWGEPRFTRDVDIALLTGFGREQEYLIALLSEYKPRIDDIEEFALKHRVVLLQTSHGIPIDVSFAALPFEENMINRASAYELVPGGHITTCSAEDLVILKAFANRDKDWNDIQTVLGAAQK